MSAKLILCNKARVPKALLLPYPSMGNAAQSFCYDGFGHDAPVRGALWQVPARRSHTAGRGAQDGRSGVNRFPLSQIQLSRMAKQKRTKAKKRRGRPVTTGRGTLIGIRCHKEFLTRVDAWRAGQAGELSRPAAIHRLAELWLDTAGRETKRGFAD
jgi:hypothetical protein